jgi:hypothetical protein
MANIIRLPHTKKFPKSKLYPKYNEIKEFHCLNLLQFLYEFDDTHQWYNSITKKFIHRNSDIVVSILSKCYNVYGDMVVKIKDDKLTYKEHIKKFIDKDLLFDVRHLPVSPNSLRAQQHALRVQQQAAVVNKPKTNSPKSPMGAAVNKPKTNSPIKPKSNSPIKSNSPPKVGIGRTPPKKASPKSPMGAATNKPRSPQQGIAAAAAAVAVVAAAVGSRTPIQFSSKTNNKGHDKNAERLNEKLCLNFVKHIKKTIQDTKTSAELKELKFANPVTGNLIGIDSPILRSFLSKCYNSFNKKEIKDIIEELTKVSDLIEEENIVDPIPIVDAKSNAIGLAFDDAKKTFYKCCDDLEANCNANGILKEHRLISNVVNSIMAMIHIKYMHINLLYKKLVIKDKKPLQIYMHDKAFEEHFAFADDNIHDTFTKIYNTNRIIYQKNNLEVANVRTILVPKITDMYDVNNLFNRQYVFEYTATNMGVYNGILTYNKINSKNLVNLSYPNSLNDAKDAFDITMEPYKIFNYNITNSTLPKKIFTNNNHEISKYFSVITDMVNTRLETLPEIKGFANETTIKSDHYNMIIAAMEKASYGNNEEGYGKKDMIRKNILYSLNAQMAQYYMYNPDHYDDIYYNSEFTGTFPLFTWIPLNHKYKQETIYNYPNVDKWQPFGLDVSVVNTIDKNYKNHGKPPWSKWLNEVVYKVIKGEYDSIYALKMPNRIQDMQDRVVNTIGLYKNEELSPTYNNKKIYLYHGAKTKLHNIADAYHQDIEIMGFLSTSLNMYTASYYAGVADIVIGLIYIIEVDDTHTYINLNDDLHQFLLLPNSIIRVIYEFNFGSIRVVLCRLIRTPTIGMNNKLYDKLLKATTSDNSHYYIRYIIKNNNNDMPVCAFMLSKYWKRYPEQGIRDLEVFSISRNRLNNKGINNTSMSKKSLEERYLYFSIGQEYELYVDRGLPLISGSFEDIKYSIHQHFIKDCYKALGIPCLDYIFIHSEYVDNAIKTGVLLEDYVNNRTNTYKYNINNFLIDCIFKFNSIEDKNKELCLLKEPRNGLYVDKIEGFRDACMYCNGVINPLFDKSGGNLTIGEHIQYIRNWKHLFDQYRYVSEEKLTNHFIWCNKRIKGLIDIIEKIKVKYLKFIEDTLNGKMKDKPLDKKGFIEKSSNEVLELKQMILTLSKTLEKRAEFYMISTDPSNSKQFIDIIRKVLSDNYINTHNSKLYKSPVFVDLILEEKQKNDIITGGIASIKDMAKLGVGVQKKLDGNTANTRISGNTGKVIDHQEIYEAYKNVPIDSSKDMRKFKDMPKVFQEYYKGAILDKDGCFDISDHCYCRPVEREL